MTAGGIVATISRLGGSIEPLEGDRLRVRPKSILTPSLLAALQHEKRAVIAFLRASQAAPSTPELLDYAPPPIRWHPDWPQSRPSAFPRQGFAYYTLGGKAHRYAYDEDAAPLTPPPAVEAGASPRMTRSEAALAMIDAFTSTGAQAFDVGLLDLAGEKQGYEWAVPADTLRRTIPSRFASADQHEHSVIIRPRSERTRYMQIDDLDLDAARAYKAVALLVIRTSPGNHQAWLALESQGKEADLDLLRRLRRGSHADVHASGSTRIAGSRNFKPKHGPDYPTVALVHVAPDRFTSIAALESLGLVAEPEPVKKPCREQAYRATTGDRWPDWEIAIRGAARKPNGEPDRSDADCRYALACISYYGRAPHEIAARLSSESPRAAEWRAKHGEAAWERQVRRTVEAAAKIARPPR